jgi:hypothetical protein
LMPITPQTVATEGRRVPHKMRGGENRRVRQTFTMEWRLVKAYISVPQRLSHQ